MKFNEILLENFVQDKKEIVRILNYYGNSWTKPIIKEGLCDITITSDGLIDSKKSIVLWREVEARARIAGSKLFMMEAPPYYVDEHGHLTLKFNKVLGNFSADALGLTTLEGSPKELLGIAPSFNCAKNTALESLEFMPQKAVKIVDFTGTAVSSFDYIPRSVTNIECNFTNITSLEGIADRFDDLISLKFTSMNIDRGGLGLILFPNLKTLNQKQYLTKPFKIIEKYLGQADKIFECQQELIEAGCEKYAVL